MTRQTFYNQVKRIIMCLNWRSTYADKLRACTNIVNLIFLVDDKHKRL